MTLYSAPIQTALFNEDGGLTPPWVYFFEQVAKNSGTAPTLYVIPYASTITPNFTNGAIQQVTLTGNITINFPVNPVIGGSFLMSWAQDATGGRIVTLNAGFKLGDQLAYGDPLTVAALGGYFMSTTELRVTIFRQGDPV